MKRNTLLRFIVTRHGGRRSDRIRMVGGDNTETGARELYKWAAERLRQGTLALVDTDASEIIKSCFAYCNRTRW